AQDLGGVRRVVTVDGVAPTSWWLPQLHGIALDRLRDPERAILAALDPAALAEPDVATHSEYARAFSPAWFHERELAPLFTPSGSESVTGATIAARLRREGYDWRDRLRALDRPTLVIHGEHDALPLQAARELVALLPRARLAV